MLTIQLIAIGLLIHESIYLSSRGAAHWSDNKAPVLGLHLDPPLRQGLHACFIGCNIMLAIVPAAWSLQLTDLIVLSVVIAAFPQRLPNHLIVAWFFLLACVANAVAPDSSPDHEFATAAIQTMTALLYGLAGLHKLNRDFFDPARSCGSGFVVHYLLQRGLKLKRWPWYATPIGIYFIVVVECALPFLLLNDSTRGAGIALALLLHVAFGFLAHIHFSTIMIAGVFAFLAPFSLGDLIFPPHYPWLPLLTGPALGLLLGNHGPYKLRLLAMANHAIFGVLVVGAVMAMIRLPPASGLFAAQFAAHPVALSGLIALFLLNGLAPYVGLKQDFSFAMFSNIRLDEWHHFLIERPLWNASPTYLLVGDLAGDDASQALRGAFEQCFPRREATKFSLSYVFDVSRELSKFAGDGEPVAIWVREPGANAKILSATLEGRRLRDKFSVFPYALPLDSSTPLLS